MTIFDKPFLIRQYMSPRIARELGWGSRTTRKWNAILSLAVYMFKHSDPWKDARLIHLLDLKLDPWITGRTLESPVRYESYVGVEEEFNKTMNLKGGVTSRVISDLVDVGKAGFEGSAEKNYSSCDAVLAIIRHKCWALGDRKKWIYDLADGLNPRWQSKSCNKSTESKAYNGKSSLDKRVRTQELEAFGPETDPEDPRPVLAFSIRALADFTSSSNRFIRREKIKKPRSWWGFRKRSVTHVYPAMPSIEEMVKSIVAIVNGDGDTFKDLGGTFPILLAYFAFYPCQRLAFGECIDEASDHREIKEWLAGQDDPGLEYMDILNFHFPESSRKAHPHSANDHTQQRKSKGRIRQRR